MTKKVVVTDYTFPSLTAEEQAARGAGANFAAFQCKSAAEVAEAVAGADVALVQFAPFGEAAAAAMQPGGSVIRYGVGDNIDLSAAARAGLRVGYVTTAWTRWLTTRLQRHSRYCGNWCHWIGRYAPVTGPQCSTPSPSSPLRRP